MNAQNRVIAISIITAICLIGDSMLYIVLPLYWKEAGLASLWEVGIVLAVNRFIRIPLNPLVGLLYRKITGGQGMLLAVVLTGISTTLYGVADHLFSWIILRCLWGVAWTLLKLGAYLMILDHAEANQRGYLLGTYNGLFRLGSLVGMLLGAILVDWIGLTLTCMLFGTCVVVSLPLVLRMMKHSPGTSEVQTQFKGERTSIKFWHHKQLLIVLTTGVVTAFIYDGMFSSTLSYLTELHYSTTLQIGGLLIGAATFAGGLQALRWGWGTWLSPIFGRLADRKGYAALFMLTYGMAGLFIALLPISLPLFLWVMVVLGALITSTAATTTLDAAAMDVASRSSKVTVMSLHTLMLDTGAALGPLISFAVADRYGIAYMYWGAAILLGLLACSWAYSWFQMRPNKTSGVMNM